MRRDDDIYKVYKNICEAIIILSKARSKYAKNAEDKLREALKYLGGREGGE